MKLDYNVIECIDKMTESLIHLPRSKSKVCMYSMEWHYFTFKVDDNDTLQTAA